MTDQDFQKYKDTANDWRYLQILKSKGMTREELYRHNRATTKGDLDNWLMGKYGLQPWEARDVSNYSMEQDDYRVSRDGVRWIAKRPAPTFEDYPELGKAPAGK